MNRLRKVMTTIALTAALSLVAGPALAHSCANTSKQSGAGPVAELTFILILDEDGTVVGEETILPEDPRVNPQGRPAGGFTTLNFAIQMPGQDPVVVASFDTFNHNDLPRQSRSGGPGDGLCDGVGIDDIPTCLDQLEQELLGGWSRASGCGGRR